MKVRQQRDGSPRLLVVEDQPTLRMIFRRLFEARGFEVTLAEELQMAKILIEHEDFDFLITDLSLSDLDRWEGLDVIGHARRFSPEMRIVVLTGQPTPELEDACLARGANAFLPKPQSLDVLTRVVTGLPETRRNDDARSHTGWTRAQPLGASSTTATRASDTYPIEETIVGSGGYLSLTYPRPEFPRRS